MKIKNYERLTKALNDKNVKNIMIGNDTVIVGNLTLTKEGANYIITEVKKGASLELLSTLSEYTACDTFYTMCCDKGVD